MINGDLGLNRIAAIYIIMNDINGKIYLGSTIDVNERWKKHKSLLKCRKHHSLHLQNAWNKHGEENFSFRILEQIITNKAVLEKELVKKEQYFLDVVQPWKDKNGYNLSKKAGRIDYELLVKSIYQLDFEGNIVKKWDSINGAARELNISAGSIVNVCKYQKGSKTTAGFRWCYESELHKYAGKKYRNKRHGPINKRVYQFDLSGSVVKIWPSIKSINKSLKISISAISRTCRNGGGPIRNYIWAFEKDRRKFADKKYNGRIFRMNVLQYDENGEIVKMWNSASDAAKKLNIDENGITATCRGKLKTSAGFQWRYHRSGEVKKNIGCPKNKFGKKLFQYDLEGNFIKEWKSTVEAAGKLNIKIGGIYNVCGGRRKSYAGFIWSRIRSDKIKAYKNNNLREVCQYSLDGNFISNWNCLRTVAGHLRMNEETLRSHLCKKVEYCDGDFIWRYSCEGV
jgi:hypothetical protein